MAVVLRPEIERRLRSGSRQVDICRALGVSKVYVNQVAREIGCGRRCDQVRLRSARRLAPVSSSEIVQMLDALPDSALLWLVAETPPGASLADTLRGIIADAHFEAVQA